MNAPQFKIKKNITLPLLKPTINEPFYIMINEPIFIGKQIGDKDAAVIANCTNLATGEECQLLLPSVFQGILHDNYGAPLYGVPKKGEPVQILHEGDENPAYVGKGFMLTKRAKPSGKQYHPIDVAELDLD